MLKEIKVKTNQREELLDITHLVREAITAEDIKNGIVHLHVPHTTAAITINENADPDVKRDILYKLNKEIPQHENYMHGEGNSDAHIKSSLFGPTLQLIIADSQLLLGTWQGILFCEFDGPRNRRLFIKILAD